MKILLIKFQLVLTLATIAIIAQSTQENWPVTGTWKGISLCQVKDSPCHDEVSVCHIGKLNASNVVKILMSKVVDGKEDEIGTLDFVYDSNAQTLTCKREDRFKSVWAFHITGKTIKGTLTTNGTLYRVIELQKAE